MPALTAEEWWVEKKNADPVLTPLSHNGVQAVEVQSVLQSLPDELHKFP